MRKLVKSFLKEGLEEHQKRLDSAREDIQATQKELSRFLAELKKTQDMVAGIRSASEKKMDGKFIEELSRRVWENLGIDLKKLESTDAHKVMREIGVIKTRLQWLERAAAGAGSSQSLSARVARLEAEIASLKASAPAVIE
jgi:chromosome segregation ATPase